MRVVFIYLWNVMIKKVRPYNIYESKKKQISKMFDNISLNYDIVNKIISFGSDHYWRKKLVERVCPVKPKKTLDVATGTAEVAIELAKINENEVFGIDISNKMLDIGNKKIIKLKLEKKVSLIKEDVENMNFSDNSFDAITIAFGVRNFDNLEKALKEVFRVMKSKGVLVILETSVPTNKLIKNLYKICSSFFLPIVGYISSKDAKAYKYLSDSTLNFPNKNSFNNILSKNGFIKIKFQQYSFGVVSIYCANKP